MSLLDINNASFNAIRRKWLRDSRLRTTMNMTGEVIKTTQSNKFVQEDENRFQNLRTNNYILSSILRYFCGKPAIIKVILIQTQPKQIFPQC